MLKTNRIFVYSDNSHFAEGLIEKLEQKYDVEVFHVLKELKNAINMTTPVALMSTVNTEENLALMKDNREILFKSQYLETWDESEAIKYGRYCVCVAARCWVDEILNASFQMLDKKIISNHVDKALSKKRESTGVIRSCDVALEDVRLKTKESQKIPVAANPSLLARILGEKAG